MQAVASALILCAHFLLLGGLGIFVFYVLRGIFSVDARARFAWMSMYEVFFLRLSTQFVLFALVAYVLGVSLSAGVWLFMSLVVLAPVGAFYLGRRLHRFYVYTYPFFMEKRLTYLRYQRKRFSPEGRKLQHISKTEAALYLDEGQKKEEELKTMEHDVWLDESTGYVKVQSYHGPIIARRCPSCEYRTSKIERNSADQEADDLGQATESSLWGLSRKKSQKKASVRCHYCGNRGSVKEEKTKATSKN